MNDQINAVAMHNYEINLALWIYFLPINYPVKKLDALDNPTGIMNVNNPMLLKIVWAAVSVLVIDDEIKVNISKAHQLITFNQNDYHPYLFIS